MDLEIIVLLKFDFILSRLLGLSRTFRLCSDMLFTESGFRVSSGETLHEHRLRSSNLSDDRFALILVVEWLEAASEVSNNHIPEP